MWQSQAITGRVKGGRAVRAREERFRSIAEATQEWIWEIDGDGLYTFCSPAAEAILGYSPDQLIGRNCLDMVSQGTRQTLADLLQRAIAEKRRRRHLGLRLEHANAGVRWVHARAPPLPLPPAVVPGPH